MTRTNRDEIKEGYVWNGYDYSLQVWIVNGVVRDCSHPQQMKKEGCCNANRLAGQRISDIPGAEKRDERKEDKPQWGPLCRVVGLLNLSAFMYMGEVQAAERRIFLYKHILTRCYLNLDSGGQGYRYDSGAYIPIDLNEALAHAFGPHGFQLEQDRYQKNIDIVELSQISPYAGVVKLFFVVLDTEISLSSLAAACESGNTDQIKRWSDRGQVLVYDDPNKIPGLSDTRIETQVLRFEEAYLIKPDLKCLILDQYKTANGILVHRIAKRSLSVFLTPEDEALCISKGVDVDLTVESLSRQRRPAIEFLIESGQARIIRNPHLEENKEEEIDLILLPNGAIVSEIN
ncbi:MAG: hypothetical protein EPO39_16265 [Candidatus Manganitrophaceae bacterium]|nr:MAG: hypothetical protein EPO39_16265 [Candidatus Manganitrophaceae bacterium]